MPRASAEEPRQRLLRWLAQRDRSEREIRERLAQWGVEAPEIEASIRDLSGRGLVNDRALAERICDWHCRHDPQGPRRLKLILERRGIPPALSAEAVAPLGEPERQRELAERLLAKRLPALKGLTPVVRARRISDYLSRRGFAADLVREIAWSLLEEPASAEEFE